MRFQVCLHAGRPYMRDIVTTHPGARRSVVAGWVGKIGSTWSANVIEGGSCLGFQSEWRAIAWVVRCLRDSR
jgi:hypothetical protein